MRYTSSDCDCDTLRVFLPNFHPKKRRVGLYVGQAKRCTVYMYGKVSVRCSLESIKAVWSPERQSGVHEGSLESKKAVWSPRRQSGVQEGSLESTKAVWSPRRQSGVHEGSLESRKAV